MSKTAMIRARIEPALKVSVERLFHKLGLTASEAIKLFYQQVRLQKGLPFEVKIPNAVTRQVFEETDRGIGLKSFKNKEELFEDLGLR